MVPHFLWYTRSSVTSGAYLHAHAMSWVFSTFQAYRIALQRNKMYDICDLGQLLSDDIPRTPRHLPPQMQFDLLSDVVFVDHFFLFYVHFFSSSISMHSTPCPSLLAFLLRHQRHLVAEQPRLVDGVVALRVPRMHFPHHNLLWFQVRDLHEVLHVKVLLALHLFPHQA